jgi:putative acetyltransferase
VITIRAEETQDAVRVRTVNQRAFGRAAEADIVERLRAACEDRVSLVAEEDGDVVGYVLFSPAVVEMRGRRVVGMGLAPLAVAPERQRQGIGAALVKRGLEILRERGCPFVVVLGHPDYYPRFGFERASAHGLTCQWEGVPDEAFMALGLDAVAMNGVSGVAAYRAEFNEAA